MELIRLTLFDYFRDRRFEMLMEYFEIESFVVRLIHSNSCNRRVKMKLLTFVKPHVYYLLLMEPKDIYKDLQSYYFREFV